MVLTPVRILRPEFLTKGCVLYMKMDEGFGNVAHDGSGYGNHGTIYGATWADGKFGKALSFDGVNDYVVGQISMLDTAPNKTFALWVKVPSAESGAAISFRLDSTNDNYFNLYPRYSGGEGRIFLSVAWKLWVYDDTGYTLPIDTWCHLVLTVSTDVIRLYLNGKEIWRAARTTQPPSAPKEYKLGNRYYANMPFNGTIDEVLIYNRALSAEEILALYRGGRFHPFRL